MISYASIDRFEGEVAVCEVELIPIENSKTTAFAEKETVMIDIPIDMLQLNMKKVEEGDIIVVEHDGENVTKICGKDKKEKHRRIKLLKKIIGT